MTNHSQYIKPQSFKHIPSLDGFRAIAVLLVVAAHCGLPYIPGGFGVTVFFFMSGFLITTLMIKEISRNGKIDIKMFYLRRLLRLTPPLILFMACSLSYTFIFTDLYISIYGILAQLFYMANFWTIFGPNTPTKDLSVGSGILWSLAVEEHFYMIFPIFFGAAWLKFRKSLGLTALALILVGCLILRLLLYPVVKSPDIHLYKASYTRFDSIGWGCAMACYINPVLSHTKNQVSWGIKIASSNISLAIASAAIISTFLIRDVWFRETFRYTIQGIALIPFFYQAIDKSTALIFRPLNFRFVRYVGKISYSIYLFHFLVMYAIQLAVNDSINAWLLTIATSILTLGIGSLSWYFLEQPLSRLRSRFHARPELRHSPSC